MTDTDPVFTFVDLFAGIGGFRCGLEEVRGRCVYSSEWDKYSLQTYEAWHGKKDLVEEDFREIDYSTVPDHDVLTAGFPCQPFSLAGVSKKNWLGQPHGFDDIRQGNMFEHIMKLVDAKGRNRPPVLFMENVKNLLSHDRGKTWLKIYQEVAKRNYHVFYDVIDAKSWVPQHRERVYMVCLDKDLFGHDRTAVGFTFPEPPDHSPVLAGILEDYPDKPTYRLSKQLWTSHQRRLNENIRLNEFVDTYRRNHKELVATAPDLSDAVKRSRFINTYLKNHRKLVAKAPLDVSALNDAVTAALHQGPPADTSAPIDISTLEKAVKSALPTKRGFGYGLAKADGQTRTLSARYYKDGAEILYKQPGWQRPRRLTPTECGRLMGFDEKYVQNQVVSDSRAYMQYGNAVVPPVVAAIGHEIVSVLTAVRSARDAA